MPNKETNYLTHTLELTGFCFARTLLTILRTSGAIDATFAPKLSFVGGIPSSPAE